MHDASIKQCKINNTTDDGTSAVAWHYDSFPFVCVTMLSDCTGMVGGETALRMPNGNIMKVRGPAMVCPILLSNSQVYNHANQLTQKKSFE